MNNNNFKLKNNSIAKCEVVNENKGDLRITLLDGANYLGDVLYEMPHGVVDKKIPGIGATTLELQAQRHSIVVLPSIMLARNKAISNDGIYVGSFIENRDGVVAAYNVDDILQILENHESAYLKFCVVADSLPKLMESINKSEGFQINDFFIMFDEIDTYQLDSDYRNRLEEVIDYYFKFDYENRCMVSATMMDFTDPRLSNQERKVLIQQEKKDKRDIAIIYTNNILQSVKNKILSLLSNSPKEEILVAFNSVQDIILVIQMLKSIMDIDCAIACSSSQKDRESVKDLYSEIGGDNKMPAQVTFITSAYFNGIDILGDVHVITVSDLSKPHTLLSEQRIYQIQGRVRNGRKSETLIQPNRNKNREVEELPISEVLSSTKLAAEDSLSFISVMEKMRAKIITDSPRIDAIRQNNMDKMRDSITGKGRYGSNLVRKNINGNYVIAFFGIDCLIEKYRIASLYNNWDGIKNSLVSMGNKITFEKVEETQSTSDSNLVKDNATQAKQEKTAIINSIVEKLKSVDPYEAYEHISSNKSTFAKKIIHRYSYLGPLFSKPSDVLPLLQKNFNKTSYNNIKLAIEFQFINREHPFKRAILNEFRIKEIYTSNEVMIKLNRIFLHPEIAMNVKLTKKTAMSYIKCLFEVKRTTKATFTSDRENAFILVKSNPKNIKGLKKKVVVNMRRGLQKEGAIPLGSAVNLL